jgi:hypothetical protein
VYIQQVSLYKYIHFFFRVSSLLCTNIFFWLEGHMHIHEIYAEARRELVVDDFRFVRKPDNHPCWETPEFIKPYPSVRLYVCKRCARTHTCQKPHENCPRLTPFRSDVVLCAISGREIGESLDKYIPGSYDLERATIQVASEAWKETKRKRTDEEEVSIATKGAINYKAQDQLMYDAGMDMDKNSGQRKMAQVADMARQREGIRDGDVYLRVKKKIQPSRQQQTKLLELDMGRDDRIALDSDEDNNAEDVGFMGGGGMDFDEQALDMVDTAFAGLYYSTGGDDDDDYAIGAKKNSSVGSDDADANEKERHVDNNDDDDRVGVPQDMIDAMDVERDDNAFDYGGGSDMGGERETALTHANGATIQIPRAELLYDDLYWLKIMDPVVAFVQARRAVYDRHETEALSRFDDVRLSVVTRQRMALESKLWNTPRLGWPLMRAGTRAEELLKHQRSIFFMVTAFLKHYQPLLLVAARQQQPPRTPPEAMPVEEYTIRIDRILDLYGCYNQDPALALHPYVESNLQRVVLTCLTSLFVKPAMVRDVDKTLFFLWQADPFLLACEKGNLFVRYHPPVSHFTTSSAGVIGATTNTNSRQKTSQLLNVIQRADIAAQHLYAVFNQFT